MSVVLVAVHPNGQSARIAVDSEAVDRDGEKRHVSKILALPHTNAIITGRAYDTTASAWRANGWPIETLHAEGEPSLALIGYSDRQRRIVAKIWGGYTNDPPRTGRDIAPYYAAPPIKGRPAPLTPLELERAAREQVQTLRAEHGPGCAAGGDLITARIDAQGIEFHRIAGALASQSIGMAA